MHTEVSKKYWVGLPAGIRGKESYSGHVNLVTAKALHSLLRIYNFIIVDKCGVHWHQRYMVLDLVDRFFSSMPSLSLDMIFLAKKPSTYIKQYVQK